MVLKPRKLIKVPCCNMECPYSSGIVKGYCKIKINPTIKDGRIDVQIVCGNEDELKVKMHCFANHMYEETGQPYLD